MTTVNTQIAETMTFNIIKQTLSHLEKNGALSLSKKECLLLFTSEVANQRKPTRSRLSAEERAAKKRAAVEQRKAERLAKKQLVAEEKAAKALAKEAAKLEKQRALEAKETAKAAAAAAAADAADAVAKRKAARAAKKKEAAAEKAAKAEEKVRRRLLKQLAKFAESEEALMEEMRGRSIAKMESYLAINLKNAAEEKERKAALKALKAQNPRPKGRAPKGKTWCYKNGEWIDTIETVDTVFLG